LKLGVFMSHNKFNKRVLLSMINEINKAIDFAPAINIKAKNLKKELTTGAKDIFEEDAEVLSEKTWELLKEGGFLVHIYPPKKEPNKIKITEVSDTQVIEEELIKIPECIITHVAETINKILYESPDDDLIPIQPDKKLMFLDIRERARELFEEEITMFDDQSWTYLEENGLVNHLLTDERLESLAETIQQNQKKMKPVIIKNQPPIEEKETQKKVQKKSKKSKKTQRPNKERINRIKQLIQENKHTNTQIALIIEKEYSMFALSGTLAIISNSKNKARTKYEKLAITDPDTKIMSFPE